jgi:hypothetical protein
MLRSRESGMAPALSILENDHEMEKESSGDVDVPLLLISRANQVTLR